MIDKFFSKVAPDPEKPFGDGLVGKLFNMQKNLYVKRDKYPIIPLEEMAQGLLEITDEQWGEYAFSRDPIGGRFTAEEKERLIYLSMACGDDYADKCRADGFENPADLAQKLGITVLYPQRPAAKAMEGDRVLFSQFTTPNKIEVFTDCTSKADDAFSYGEMAELLGNIQMKDLLLSHEIFHYFEHIDRATIFTENEKKNLPIFKVIPNRSRIMCLGEIAAMRFTRNIMSLPYSPYVFDVLLSYLYNKQVACNLYAQTRNLLFGENIPQVTEEG